MPASKFLTRTFLSVALLTLPAAALATAGSVAHAAIAPETGTAAAATTWHIAPGSLWQTTLTKVAPGDTVILDAGTHPAQMLQNLNLSSVTVQGASRTGTVVQGIYLTGSSGLTFRNLTVTSPTSGSFSSLRVTNGTHDITFDQLTVLPKNNPSGRSGLDIYSNSGSSRPPYRIKMFNSLIDAKGSTGTASRGVRLWGGEYSETTWPHDITFARNEVRNASSDLIQIGGAKNVLIADNLLHDPLENSDHNDAIQSYGSRGLRISGNRIWAAGTQGGPDQGLMIGDTDGKTYLRVNDTKIENNIIAGWRGQGICMAGSDVTLIRQNTVVNDGGSGLVIGRTSDHRNNRMTVSNNIFDRIDRDDSLTLAYEDYNLVTRSTGNARGTHTKVGAAGFAETKNYTLTSTSLAKNAGNASTGVVWDYGGASAVGVRDIGAREYGANDLSVAPTGAVTGFTTGYDWGGTYGR